MNARVQQPLLDPGCSTHVYLCTNFIDTFLDPCMELLVICSCTERCGAVWRDAAWHGVLRCTRSVAHPALRAARNGCFEWPFQAPVPALMRQNYATAGGSGPWGTHHQPITGMRVLFVVARQRPSFLTACQLGQLCPIGFRYELRGQVTRARPRAVTQQGSLVRSGPREGAAAPPPCGFCGRCTGRCAVLRRAGGLPGQPAVRVVRATAAVRGRPQPAAASLAGAQLPRVAPPAGARRPPRPAPTAVGHRGLD
jgi:hypothetical protein